jgi:PH (Pleckstrin Homology) domain-containing protein/putative oligomerization/nucleic acid binding protein
MPYLDQMLASGEQPIRRDHQHWFVLVADAFYGFLAIVAAMVLFFLSQNLTGGIRDVLSIVVPVLLIGGLLYILWEALRWRNEEYIVTSRRVLRMEGVINKRVIDSSLEKINDAVLTQSIFGRMFGFGDLEILTASETGISILRMLRQPDDFKRAMLDAKHDLELELSGAKPLPAPPIRMQSAPRDPLTGAPPAPMSQPSAGSGPAPSAASSGSARADLTADEVTRTLGNLADLRDRGAISAEEYEAKKADLLRRL